MARTSHRNRKTQKARERRLQVSVSGQRVAAGISVAAVVGLIIAGIGVVWLLAPSIPWLGKLPGDIRIEGEKTRIYIPITSCILLSLLLTGIMWLVRFLSR